LAYHNHDFEFAAIGGTVPYDLILAGTDPRTVQMEMDLYWVTKAGLNPVSLFEKHPGRFPLVHVKDMDNTPRKFFTEVGRGVIDFRTVFSKAKEAGIKHYFIEQDETPGDPLESVEISLNYLRALKF
jgi:sugar phosphate isomerase/epimerase